MNYDCDKKLRVRRKDLRAQHIKKQKGVFPFVTEWSWEGLFKVIYQHERGEIGSIDGGTAQPTPPPAVRQSAQNNPPNKSLGRKCGESADS